MIAVIILFLKSNDMRKMHVFLHEKKQKTSNFIKSKRVCVYLKKIHQKVKGVSELRLS